MRLISRTLEYCSAVAIFIFSLVKESIPMPLKLGTRICQEACPTYKTVSNFPSKLDGCTKHKKARLSEAEYLLIYLLIRVKNYETGTIFVWL